MQTIDATAKNASRDHRLPRLHPVVVASGVSVTLVVAAGVAMVAEPWFGLRHFGGEQYVPRLVGLAITRAWAAWGAAVVVTLHVTAVLHAGSSGHHPRAQLGHRHLALLAGAAVPLLAGPVGALALVSAMALTTLGLGLPPGAFFEFLEPRDFLRGAGLAVLFGGVPAAWSLLGARFARSPRHGLALKLLGTWLVLLTVSFAGGCALAVFGAD